MTFEWLKSFAQHAENAVTQTSKILNILGIIGAALLMLLICADVIGRLLFNSSIAGTVSISQFTLVCVVYCSVAYCAIVKGHVRVDMIIARLRDRAQAVINLTTGFVSLALFSLLAWATARVLVDSWHRGEVSLDQLEIPVWPFRAVLLLGIIILCLVLLVDFCHLIARFAKK